MLLKMNDETYSETISTNQPRRKAMKNIFSPGLLIPYIPDKTLVSSDRFAISDNFIIGRNAEECTLQIKEGSISKKHFILTLGNKHTYIEDLGSLNGTYVNGDLLKEKQLLRSPSVIRAGEVLLVYHDNIDPMLITPANSFGIIGDFYVKQHLDELKAVAKSSRHVLLAGPSGSGKELAAKVIATMKNKLDAPFVAHNAAKFSSEEEATTTIFGVVKGVFSFVDTRQGLIEKANNGILFLDEIHNLSEKVQRSLLRVLEDKSYSRIGETINKNVDVLFIFATNEPGPTYLVPHDIRARTRTVEIPSLQERVADIPAIFNYYLKKYLKKYDIDEHLVFDCLVCDHYEQLCSDGFPTYNVRGIIDIVDRIATRIATGTDPEDVITIAFDECFSREPSVIPPQIIKSSHEKSQESNTLLETNEVHAGSTLAASVNSTIPTYYEKNKATILKTYKECGNNKAATVRELMNRGIKVNRNTLSLYIDKWNVLFEE